MGALTSSDEHPRGAGHPGQAVHTGRGAGQAEGGDAAERLGVHQPDPVVQAGHQEVVCGQRIPFQGRDRVLFVGPLRSVGPQNMSLALIAC